MMALNVPFLMIKSGQNG